MKGSEHNFGRKKNGKTKKKSKKNCTPALALFARSKTNQKIRTSFLDTGTSFWIFMPFESRLYELIYITLNFPMIICES